MAKQEVILEQTGDDFVKQTQHGKALEAYRESVKLQANGDFSKDSPTMELLFEKVGNMEIICARYGESCDSYQRAMDIHLIHNPPASDSLLGKWFSTYGQREHEIGRYSNALDYFRRAYDSYVKSETAEDKSSAVDVQKASAKTFFCQNAYQLALQTLENAKTDYETFKCTDHHGLAEIHCLRGDVYTALCQYDLAKQQYSQAQELLRNAELKPVTGALHLSIARLATELGVFKAASTAVQGANKVYIKLFPDNPSNLHTAMATATAGYLSFRQGDYRLSQFSYRHSMNMLTATFGDNLVHPYHANTLENEAAVLMKLGEYENAIYNFQLASNTRWKAFELVDGKHIDIAKGLDCEAEVLTKLGRYGEALCLHEKALALKIELIERGYRINSIEIARSDSLIADVYTLQNSFQEAEKFYHKCVARQKEIYSIDAAKEPSHVDIVKTLCKLSKVYTAMRRFDSALNIAYEGYSMCNVLRSQGARPHIHADPLISIAEIYESRVFVGKARDLYKQAVQLRKEGLGENHPDVADALMRLGNVQAKTCEFEQGIQNVKMALEIYCNIYCDIESHADIASCVECLGNMYFGSGKFLQALECYTKSLVVYKESYGDVAHPSIARCLRGIGLSYLEEGLSLDSARLNLCKSQDMFWQVFGTNSNHLEIAKSWYSIGNLEIATKNNRAALEAYMKCLRMFHTIQSVRSPIWADIMLRVGRIFDLQGENAASLKFYRACFSINRELTEKCEHSFETSDVTLLAKIGKSLFRLGDYQKAKKTLNAALAFLVRIVNKDSDIATLEASINYMLGKIEERVGEDSDGADHYLDLSKTQCMRLRCASKQLRLLYQRFAFMAATDGKFEESNSMLCQALSEMPIENCENGKERGQVVSMLDRMGDNYYTLGRYESALKRYKEALTVLRQFGEEQWLALGHSHQRLALVYEQLGKYVISHQHLLKCQVHFERVYGQKVHPDVFLLKAHIGFSLTNLNQLKDAQESLKEAFKDYQTYMVSCVSKIDCKEKVVRMSCGFLQTYLRYRGWYNFKTDKLTMAVKALCDAYHSCLTYDIKTPEKALIIYQLALCLKKQMRLPEALELMEDALLSWREFFNQHPDMADCHHHMAQIQEQLRKYDEAFLNYDIAYTMKSKFVQADEKTDIAYYEDMASLYRNKRDWHQYLEHLRKMVEIMKLAHGKNDLAETLEDIANIYSLLGDKDKQQIFVEEAEATRSFISNCPSP